jgi:hypothetical protein
LSILKRIAPKEEPKNLPEQLDLDLDLVSQVDFSAPMTPSPESHPASPQASPPASPRHDMSTSAPSQLPDISFQPTQSSWTRFLETVQNALADCRACSHWESNPNNLADTLNSIAEKAARMQNQPPREESAWTDPRLEEVLFCVTSFKREGQLKKALPLNLLCLAPYRRSVKIVLVTFGPDEALQQWLQNELAWAVEANLLQLASGGDASGTVPPAGRWEVPRRSKPLTSWHAPVAKNTSHVVAACCETKSLEKTLLINLDGDNLIGLHYLGAVAKAALDNKKDWHGKACTAIGCGTGSLTGRLAYWALDFYAICGYDQESDILPSGQKTRKKKKH